MLEYADLTTRHQDICKRPPNFESQPERPALQAYLGLAVAGLQSSRTPDPLLRVSVNSTTRALRPIGKCTLILPLIESWLP